MLGMSEATEDSMEETTLFSIVCPFKHKYTGFPSLRLHFRRRLIGVASTRKRGASNAHTLWMMRAFVSTVSSAFGDFSYVQDFV